MSTACGTQHPITHGPPAQPGGETPQKNLGGRWTTPPPAHLVHVLQVEPGVEGTGGQVQVRELELGHAGADVPLILIDAEDREAQAVLLQRCRVQRDGEALVKGHGISAPLNLPRGGGGEGDCLDTCQVLGPCPRSTPVLLWELRGARGFGTARAGHPPAQRSWGGPSLDGDRSYFPPVSSSS